MIPLPVFFIVLLVVLGAAYWRWSRRVESEIAEGADVEWSLLQKHDQELVGGMERAQFDAIYRRVYFPRFPKYALAALTAFFLALPVIFALLQGGLWMMEEVGWTPEPASFADRYLIEGDSMRIITAAPPEAALYYAEALGGFYYFFGVFAAWALIVAVVMRQYHARKPGFLREEIIRAR